MCDRRLQGFWTAAAGILYGGNDCLRISWTQWQEEPIWPGYGPMQGTSRERGSDVD